MLGQLRGRASAEYFLLPHVAVLLMIACPRLSLAFEVTKIVNCASSSKLHRAYMYVSLSLGQRTVPRSNSSNIK